MRGGLEPHHLSLWREELKRKIICVGRQSRDLVCDLLHGWRYNLPTESMVGVRRGGGGEGRREE